MKVVWIRNFFHHRRARQFPAPIPEERQVNAIGYTVGGLVAVMAALLTAAIGFSLLLLTTYMVFPVQFKDLGLSNTWIAFFVTTVPYAITTIVNPVVSYASDRTRTRRGRRLPYLLWTVPAIAVILLLIGGSGRIGAALDMQLPWLNGYGPVAVLAILIVLFNLVFMIPGAVFWYVFPDVLPKAYLGRFMSYFNLVQAAANFCFSRWLLPLTEKHIEWLYCGLAVTFLITMYVLVFTVREGHYPPPPRDEKAGGPFAPIVAYCKECYGIPYYYPFFITMALSDVSTICRSMYNLIYARDVLAIPVQDYGAIMGWGSVLGLALCLPLGYLCDRWNPLIVFGLGLVTVIGVNFFSYFYVCDYASFYITTMMLAVVYTIQQVSTIPVFVASLPKDLYGQFCSANALFRSILMALGGLGGGLVLDWTGNYQNIYLWDFIFTAAAFGTFLLFYINWRRRQNDSQRSHDSVPNCAGT